jgi:hypothetical protein
LSVSGARVIELLKRKKCFIITTMTKDSSQKTISYAVIAIVVALALVGVWY